MNLPSARHALADSALALLAACVAIAMFLPPWAAETSRSLPRTVCAVLTIALTLPLHWALLGLAAQRLGRSVAGWVSLSVLLFPVGGAASLLLLSGLRRDTPATAAAH